MISHDEAQKRMSYKFGPKAGFDWQWLENMNEEFDDKKKIYRAGVRTQPIQRIKRFVPEMKWDFDQMYDKILIEQEKGETYEKKVSTARRKGFRRAKKYMG